MLNSMHEYQKKLNEYNITLMLWKFEIPSIRDRIRPKAPFESREASDLVTELEGNRYSILRGLRKYLVILS